MFAWRTQAGNARRSESTPQAQDWTLPLFSFNSKTSPPILSFCAEPKVESQNPSSKEYPPPSGRGGTVADEGWGPWKSTFPHPSSALTDTFSLSREKVFLRCFIQWILQLRAGMPFVQNDMRVRWYNGRRNQFIKECSYKLPDMNRSCSMLNTWINKKSMYIASIKKQCTWN